MANSTIGGGLNNNVWYVDFGVSNHMTCHGKWFKDTRDLKTLGFMELVMTLHIPSRWANKVLEICISCSNHNKKIGLHRPDGGTRFTCDIQP
jgi:hypothetical protein